MSDEDSSMPDAPQPFDFTPPPDAPPYPHAAARAFNAMKGAFGYASAGQGTPPAGQGTAPSGSRHAHGARSAGQGPAPSGSRQPPRTTRSTPRPQHTGHSAQPPPQPPAGHGPPPSPDDDEPPTGNKRRRTSNGPDPTPRTDDGPEPAPRTNDEPGPSPRKKPRSQPSPTAQSKAGKKKKTGRRDWHIPSKKVAENAKGLQIAMNLHIRISMGLLSQSAVPRLAAADKDAFEKRYASADDLRAQLDNIIDEAIPPTDAAYARITEYLKTFTASNSQNARDAARIGENHLRVIFNAIANAGLTSFSPDVLGNEESMYNLVHEHLAIHTFRALATAYAYTAQGVDLSLVKEYHILRSFYRSFAYGRLRKQVRQEAKNPGRVELLVTKNNVYRRRIELRIDRCKQIKDDCFSKRVRRLAKENSCHSDDDEPTGGSAEYMIHEKPGRDEAVTAIFRIVSGRSKDTKESNTKGKWVGRTRTPGLVASDTSLRLPKNVPIDYFSPKFFNGMSVRQRATYMNNGIALPLLEHCGTWEDIKKWKGLDDATFMRDYGKDKRALYEIPTEAELARLEEDDEEEDEEDEEDDDE
ncbi:hypothetical protein B0H11DRAFT_2253266 [Mycena galericulata]|nr:hypothetical protein B0H11DRAFT_2253266 [Mycena galericulata]